MSKSSPIYITDDSDDEKYENALEIFSGDDNTTPVSLVNSENMTPCCSTVKVKSESVDNSPTKPDMNVSPKGKVTLDQNRLKWLSGVIKLPGVTSPVKSERCEKIQNLEENLSHCSEIQVDPLLPSSPQPTSGISEEDKNGHLGLFPEKQCLPSSPISYEHFPDMNTGKSPNTSKKSTLQKAIESPRKSYVFGSSHQTLKQCHISEDSFSPKKPMQLSPSRIDDSSHHTPALHAAQINGYGCVVSLDRPILMFSESQLNFLEAIKEEGLMERYIDTLLSLVSKYRKPPPQLCYSIISELLLKSENNYLTSKSFWALKRIQALHPSVPEQIEKKLLTWELIENIVERMELTSGCKCKNIEGTQDKPCVKSSSAAKTLTFLIDVMESEVQRKQFSLRRTIGFRMLSLQRLSRRNVSQVLRWLMECVTQCCKNKEFADDSKVFDIMSGEACIGSKESQHYYALGLFQRLIQLSISVSEDPEKCAAELAGEILVMYNQLTCLESRTIFLQSLHSHLLRSHFLKLYLDVYCKDTELDRIASNYSGVQRIVEVDFERLPQKREITETRKCHEWHRTEQECEEMAMVLSYSLQSYLFCHHKKLQSTPTRVTFACSDGVQESREPGNRRHLSISDSDQLCNMGDKVMVLTGRIMSLCQGSVNKRSCQLLDLLSQMKLWDPW